MYRIYSIILLAFALTLTANAQTEPALKCVLELYDITPRMNGEDPTDYCEELSNISFTITGKYHGYGDMTIAGYNPALLATAADHGTTKAPLAGIYTYGGMEFVEPFSIGLTGNDVTLNFDPLPDGQYTVFFPDQLFRSEVTADNYVLITPVVKMRYRVNGGTVGIEAVEPTAVPTHIYDLQGRSAGSPARGLRIVNGKKVKL